MAKDAIYDKPADQWTDKEIEVEKLRLERSRSKAETSLGRTYGTVILSAVVGAVGTLLTWYTNDQADVRAHKAAEEETARTLSQNAVRVYFENPDRFDLSKEEGVFNLRLLAATAPGTTTETLLNRIQSQVIANAVTAQTAAVDAAIAAPATTAAAAAANPAAAPAPSAPQAVQQVADDVRYAAIQNAPSLVENASKPGDFAVYVQYAAGAADQAKAVQGQIAKMGFNAPGVEEVKVSVTGAQVRFYRPGQEKIAQELASSLGGVLGTKPAVQYVGANRKLPDGILEVWLPGSAPAQANSAALGKAFSYVQNQMRQEALRRIPNAVQQTAPAPAAPSAP